MSIEVKNYSGSEMGSVSVSEKVFGAEVNVDLMQMASVRQLNNARLGTACTKTRTEVRGGGRKPWKQKGTGRARAGSRTSPVWRGGGVTFGPRPRSFATALNRKMSAGALASALSANREQVIVVDAAQLNVAKTSDFIAFLKNVGIEKSKRVLLVSEYNEALFRASRNLRHVSVVNPQNLGVVDILGHDTILVASNAMEILERRVG